MIGWLCNKGKHNWSGLITKLGDWKGWESIIMFIVLILTTSLLILNVKLEFLVIAVQLTNKKEERKWLGAWKFMSSSSRVVYKIYVVDFVVK